MENPEIDVAIIGGGMTGGALALGLAQQGFRVAVAEHAIAAEYAACQPPDVRVSAISMGSVALLEQLNVWQSVMNMRCHAYQRLETWEWDNAHVIFDARQLQLPQLGYMVENLLLQRALWESLEQHPQVTLYAPAQLAQLTAQGERRRITLDNGQTFTARLVVGADGANSRVRQQAGLGIYGWQYRQHCLLITVNCATAPGDASWQRFTPDGPQALLPLFDQWATLAWYHHPSRIRQLEAMTAAQLREQILLHFPARLGDITPVNWQAFPLTRRHAQSYIQPGCVLVGDAAHTIHPLAGQGVNLGYRDVRCLLDVLSQARQRGEKWDDYPVLRRYQRRRMPDNQLMQSAMDLFYLTFSNDRQPLRIARNLALMAAERAGVLKRQTLKYALGL